MEGSLFFGGGAENIYFRGGVRVFSLVGIKIFLMRGLRLFLGAMGGFNCLRGGGVPFLYHRDSFFGWGQLFRRGGGARSNRSDNFLGRESVVKIPH